MNYRKLLGYILISAAMLSALFCVIGIVQIWRFEAVAVQAAADSYDVMDETLHTTDEGLAAIDDMISAAARDTALLQTTVHTITLSIEDSGAVLDALSTLTGEDLPTTIAATQVSLESAQTSAKLIDDFLAGLARIPLLRLGTYQPEVPLTTAIGDISTSLDPLTPTLEEMSGVLDSAAANIDSLESDLEEVAETTRELATALEDGQAVITDYREIVADLNSKVETLQDVTPGYVRSAVWLGTFFFVSLLFAQVGLGDRGWEMVRGKKSIESIVSREEGS